ncbi:hypothetical protein [Paenibacillus naphthalenovorans]|uniref:hypothetical protein n=1 Tax=Paenibacillus naphthalenovorans TaxID=162209 RepID=UPI003AAB82ED
MHLIHEQSSAMQADRCRSGQAGGAAARKQDRVPKLKEIRLTPGIEEQDYETKLQQAQKILKSGDSVMFVVRAQGKEEGRGKALLEDILRDLSTAGRKKRRFRSAVSKLPFKSIRSEGEHDSPQLD